MIQFYHVIFNSFYHREDGHKGGVLVKRTIYSHLKQQQETIELF